MKNLIQEPLIVSRLQVFPFPSLTSNLQTPLLLHIIQVHLAAAILVAVPAATSAHSPGAPPRPHLYTATSQTTLKMKKRFSNAQKRLKHIKVVHHIVSLSSCILFLLIHSYCLTQLGTTLLVIVIWHLNNLHATTQCTSQKNSHILSLLTQ